jgi:hypothetical protein
MTRRLKISGMAILCLAAMATATTLSDNLSLQNYYSDPSSDTSWLAANFQTDGQSYQLADVTLLLANVAPGTAEVDLYSGVNGQPGSLIRVLSDPASYSSVLANTVFWGDQLLLSPDSSYWIVLKSLSGEFDWGYTASNSGTGVGFTHLWGSSDDAGASPWYTSDLQPYQMSVGADPVTVAAPEPASASFLLVTAALAAVPKRRRRRCWIAA